MKNPLPLAILVLAALLLKAPVAPANLRAPRTVAWLPSTAPRAAADALTVEHETLEFRCQHDTCQVRATYYVRSTDALTAELRFVVPVKARVVAHVGAKPGVVVLREAPSLRTELDTNVGFNYPDSARPTIYQATVEVPIAVGKNELVFEYDQPLGATETDYGYSRGDGDMVQHFAYGLWPLREWKRSPSFYLLLKVALLRPEPSCWKRWFGSVKGVACGLGEDFPLDPPSLPQRWTQRGDWLWLEAKLALPRTPVVLRCSIGDDVMDD